MAFPTTSVLDDFLRANEVLGAPNWTQQIRGVEAGTMNVVSNAAAPVTGEANSYWSLATFGPDSEVYLTVSTLGADTKHLWVRVTTPGASVDCYHATFDGTDRRIWRLDNGTYTQLGAVITGTALSSGDGIGFEAVGTSISVYAKTSGVWNSEGLRTDATYDAAGYIGMGVAQVSNVFDDFGGGSIGGPVVVSGGIGTFRTDRIRSRRTSW